MNAIEILNRCRDAQRDIKRLDERLARLRECASSSTSCMDRIGGRSSGVGDKVSTFAVDIADIEDQIAKRKRAYEAEMLAACKIVDMLPESECVVLYRYYVQGQTQGGIAAALNYSVSYVKRKKQDGLKLAEQIAPAAVDALLPAWYVKAERG